MFAKVTTPSCLQVIFTGPDSSPYYKKRRIAIWWRWDAELLRQSWWRCLQDMTGVLLFNCGFWKHFFCFLRGSKLLFKDFLDVAFLPVITNNHMHWSMQKLGYEYILFFKKILSLPCALQNCVHIDQHPPCRTCHTRMHAASTAASCIACMHGPWSCWVYSGTYARRADRIDGGFGGKLTTNETSDLQRAPPTAHRRGQASMMHARDYGLV